MNDSFLEELDLIPKNTKAQNNSQINNRHVTIRKVLSPPTNIRTKINIDNSDAKQDKIISSSSSNVAKIKASRRSGSQEPRKSIPESKPLSSTPKSEKKNEETENLIKPEENQTKVDDFKIKPSDVRTISKAQDNKSIRNRRSSGSTGSSSRYLDASSKENTRPSIDSSSSRESGTQADLKKDASRRISDGLLKKSDLLEKTDPVMLLNAIKDLISRYSEQETVKVLRTMQNLHINSQANLIKHLMLQTNELVKELNLHKNPGNVKSLIEENEKMREDIFLLRARNEVLQKKVDELALIKEENISLKIKLKELQQ